MRVRAWIDQWLTKEVLHNALLSRVRQPHLVEHAEMPEKSFVRQVGFVIARQGEVREVIWISAYGLQVLGHFGFLCEFAVRVPQGSTISDKHRLELSLTHKNGRANEDFYLDQNKKIETFIKRYFSSISSLSLHDGTRVDIEPRLSVIPSFTLARRTYVFGDGREGRNQFFGLRDFGPFQPADLRSLLVFVFAGPDRERSQHLFRALRGDIYSTFRGMEPIFRAAISRENVSGFEVQGFTHHDLEQTCATLKAQYPKDRIVPVVLVPMTRHTSEKETEKYYTAKHAFISTKTGIRQSRWGLRWGKRFGNGSLRAGSRGHRVAAVRSAGRA